MATSKRFKKKCKDFRQGMTAWRIWGWTLHPENALGWAADKKTQNLYHGEGNWFVLPLKNFKGFETRTDFIFVYCEHMCAVGYKDTLGTYVKPITHRKTGKRVSDRAGSACNRYFAKQKQARAFLEEISKGLQLDIIRDLA